MMLVVCNSQLHIELFPLGMLGLSMFDVLASREKVDLNRFELIEALERHRKIFSSPYKLESTLEDLSIDFHTLHDETRSFVRIAMRHVEELENILEKDEKLRSLYLSI